MRTIFFICRTLFLVMILISTISWAQAQETPQQLLARLTYRAASYQATLSKQEKHSCPVGVLLCRDFANTADAYCFYYGVRYDEPHPKIGGRVNRDLEYGRGDTFTLNFNGGNDSVIRDMGAVNFNDVKATPAIGNAGEAKAANKHVYLMAIHCSDYDMWAKMQILEMQAGQWIIFRWERLNDTAQITGTRSGLRWDGRYYADNRGHPDDRATRAMKTGIVKLQLRAGAGGGNPNQISMAGDSSIYVDKVQWTPIAMTKTIDSNDESTAYYSGGFVPKGKVWLVNKVTYNGLAKGDSNGRGEFILRIAGWLIAHESQSPYPFNGTSWVHIVVHPGQERYVYAEVANSSECNVTIEGQLLAESDPKAK